MMEGVKKFFSIGKKKPKELSDPYLTFSFAGQTVQSKVMYETYSPEFNQELKLGFKVGATDPSLIILLNCRLQGLILYYYYKKYYKLRYFHL